MNCDINVFDIIGIKGCEDLSGTSPYYIQDLPYMNIPNLSKAVDTDIIEHIKQRINFSFQYTSNRLATLLMPSISVKNILENSTIGRYRETRETYNINPNRLKGIIIKSDASLYTDLIINKLNIYSAETKATTLYIYDLNDGVLIDSRQINLNADEINRIELNIKICDYPIFVFIGIPSDVKTYKTRLNSNGCNCGRKHMYITTYTAEFDTGQPIYFENRYNLEGTGGIIVFYNLICNWARFVYSIKEVVALPVLYKTGELLAKDLRTSTRLNNLIIINSEIHQELDQYFFNEYEQSINDIIKYINMPADACFSCTGRVRTMIRI